MQIGAIPHQQPVGVSWSAFKPVIAAGSGQEQQVSVCCPARVVRTAAVVLRLWAAFFVLGTGRNAWSFGLSCHNRV